MGEYIQLGVGQSGKSSWRKWHLYRALKNRVKEVGSDWLSDRAFFWLGDIFLHSGNSKQPFIEHLLCRC